MPRPGLRYTTDDPLRRRAPGLRRERTAHERRQLPEQQPGIGLGTRRPSPRCRAVDADAGAATSPTARSSARASRNSAIWASIATEVSSASIDSPDRRNPKMSRTATQARTTSAGAAPGLLGHPVVEADPGQVDHLVHDLGEDDLVAQPVGADRRPEPLAQRRREIAAPARARDTARRGASIRPISAMLASLV